MAAVETHCLSSSPQASPDHNIIMVDFEAAALAAVRQVFGDYVDMLGCFYNLMQATWCKIQALSLATLCRDDEQFRLFVGMLDGLAFLPVDDVSAGLAWLKTVAPANLVTYFWVKGHSRSLKLVPFESLGAVSYSPSIVTMALSCISPEILVENLDFSYPPCIRHSR